RSTLYNGPTHGRMPRPFGRYGSRPRERSRLHVLAARLLDCPIHEQGALQESGRCCTARCLAAPGRAAGLIFRGAGGRGIRYRLAPLRKMLAHFSDTVGIDASDSSFSCHRPGISPVLGAVTAPTTVLIRPDGYVAWVRKLTQQGLTEDLTTWLGPPIESTATQFG